MPKQVPEPPRSEIPNLLWIAAIATLLLLILCASLARAGDENYLACPPGATNVCEASVQAPASPQVDRVCLRKFGTTVLDPALCVDVTPGATAKITFKNPTAGTGHIRYELVACDSDLDLCSEPAAKNALAVDIDIPTLVEILRKAFGLQ